MSTQLLAEGLHGMDGRDAGLATELVLGVLRRRAQLDWLIDARASRPAAGLDAAVRVALEMGVYQLRFLSRVPAHAAVMESVELVKRAGYGSAAGFVNAVLRRLPGVPEKWGSPAVRASMPAWLWMRWRREFGEEAAMRAAEAGLETPGVYVRVKPGEAVPEGLEATGVEGCWRAAGMGSVPAGLRVMDIGAQAVAGLLAMEPGQRLLDVCAAPGNKTAVALETEGVRAVACDASPRRLKAMLLEEGAAARVRVDAARGLPFGAVFDRVLVDAPCTGTGTLARNPEIKWRLTEEEVERQAERQKAILRNALACLKPGGRLVYATCSLEREENEGVVAAVAVERVKERHVRLPGREEGDGFQVFVMG